ncbi:MAG: CARDB domain-containing protein [Candidatus Micrarchaeia archaeon]
MDAKSKNILFYGALAIIVVAAFSAYFYMSNNQVYNVAVSLSELNSSSIYYPYQTSLFNITIYNKGSNGVSGMVVNFYSNGSVVNSYKVSLPPHKNVSIKANYTYSLPGNYVFSAVADPAHLLNLENRPASHASLNVVVYPASLPNVYTSIPNNGINYTQTFTLSSSGMAFGSFIYKYYNISLVSGMIGIPSSITEPLFADLSSLVENANGAFSIYHNGTKAYSLWLQGYLNKQTVDTILSTFRLESHNSTLRNSTITFYKVNNATSVCTLYSGGWTKMISYYNNSYNATCLSLLLTNYTPTESSALISLLKNNTEIRHYQSGFVYKNSTYLGTSLFSFGNSTGIGFANMFEEAPYGLFISSIIKNPVPMNISSNLTCRGLIYANGTSSICSSLVIPYKSNNTFYLINSSEILRNYTVLMYSLVNSSELVSAHYNSAHLIYALGINSSAEKWSSALQNVCSLNNASIKCSVHSFDYADNTANVSIENGFAFPLHINSASCYMPGLETNETVNATLLPTNSVSFELPCHTLSVPLASAMTSYILVVNYTIQNKSHIGVGALNVTNFV